MLNYPSSEIIFTLTISFGNTTSARPQSHSEDYLSLSGSSTFRFTETSQIKVQTYSASGVSVSHSGNTWTFTLSASGSGTGYQGGNWASTSKSGTATITFEVSA